MRSPKLTAEHLARRAVVYVRQSTQHQVLENLESQRRQYALAELAREMGFEVVDVIDDDLGRSGSGNVERPGFERLFGELAGRDVGAILCLEASRLARNGREWHMLLDMCAVVGTLIAGPEGVYDPKNGDDRLLLGLKGSVAEYELTMLRQRAQKAIEAKAERGELQFCLPVGVCWALDGGIELNPDLRVQEAIRLVFAKYMELGSIRQVQLWFRQEEIPLPTRWVRSKGSDTQWHLPTRHTISRALTSPFYAGAYVWGRTERKPSSTGASTTWSYKPQDRWRVLILDHHPGYITWDEHLRIRQMMSDNAHNLINGRRKAGRGGRALLAGLLRCRRCGRRLNTKYTGRNNARYECPGDSRTTGGPKCISFSGVNADPVIAAELIAVVQQPAVEAALAAVDEFEQRRQEALGAVELELEQARYRARLAERRYEQADPDNRLVAAELERRWNEALRAVHIIESRLATRRAAMSSEAVPDREQLLALAADLHSVWHDERTDGRTRQRIARTLIEEIVVDVDLEVGRVSMLIHWFGGRHSEASAKRRRAGQHRLTTSKDIVDIVRQMAGYCEDKDIAGTLNRLRLRTATGLTWTAARVQALRFSRGITDALVAAEADLTPAVTLKHAALALGTNTIVVRRLIKDGLLPAEQVVPFAPWRIPEAGLQSPQVLAAVAEARLRARGRPRHSTCEERNLVIPGT